MKITVKKVHELEKVFSGKIEVLTEKGSKAGENRRLKALSQTPDVFDQSIDIDENASGLVLEFKNKTGLNIRLTDQYIHELKELLLKRNEEREKKAKEALGKNQKLQEEENRNLKAAEHKRHNTEREAFIKAEQETKANDFIKQQHSVDSISEGFQKLIDSYLADGKLTKEEKEVLLKRAAKDGLDHDEFELYIQGLLDKIKKERRNKTHKNISSILKKSIFQSSNKHIKIPFEKSDGIINDMKGVLFGGVKKEKEYKTFRIPAFNFRVYHILLIVGLFLTFVTISFFNTLSYNKTQNELLSKYRCTNFDDCLSKFEFDGAYHFYSQAKGSKKNRKLKELISAQITFWSVKGDFAKAYSILSEYTFNYSPELSFAPGYSSNSNYNIEANFYNDQVDKLISKMIIQDMDKGIVMQYFKLYKPLVVGDEKDKNFAGNFNSSVLSEEPYEKALIKYNN